MREKASIQIFWKAVIWSLKFSVPSLMLAFRFSFPLTGALLFGSSQLPKLARSLGKAKSEFEEGIREGSKGDAERPGPDEHVTMTRAELDVLIAEHEAKARKDTPPT